MSREETLKKYNNNEKGKAARQRYLETKKGIEAYEKYRDSEKYRKTSREYRKQYRKDNPEKTKAHDKVTDEIRAGRLKPASSFQCAFCDSQAAHYHHNDYSKPLEILPVCYQHHSDIHKAQAQSASA